MGAIQARAYKGAICSNGNGRGQSRRSGARAETGFPKSQPGKGALNEL